MNNNSIFNNIATTLSTFNYSTAVSSTLGVKFAEMAKQLTNQAQQAKTPEEAQQFSNAALQYSAQANKIQEIAAQFQIGGIDTQNRIAQASLKLLG
jgi:hypothetical protein